MAVTVIPFPTPRKEKPYTEPYEAEYLAFVAADVPVRPAYRGGLVPELSVKSLSMANGAPSAYV